MTLKEAYERILMSRPGRWKAEVDMQDAGLGEGHLRPIAAYEKPAAAPNVVALGQARRSRRFEWPERVKYEEGVER